MKCIILLLSLGLAASVTSLPSSDASSLISRTSKTVAENATVRRSVISISSCRLSPHSLISLPAPLFLFPSFSSIRAIELTMTFPLTLQFDDLPPPVVSELDPVPVPYKNLNFSGYGVNQPGLAAGAADGVVPASGSQYAASGPVGRLRSGNPLFSIVGTNTTSFDLLEFSYGCVVASGAQQGQVAEACSFTVSGTKAVGGGTVGPVSFSFKPSSTTEASMALAQLGTKFVGVKEVEVVLTSATSGTATTVFLVDDVVYFAHLK